MPKNWITALSLIAIGLVMMWMSFGQKPLYKASSTVIIDIASPGILAIEDIAKLQEAHYLAYRTYMETQREIIKSKRVADHVIKNLGLKDTTGNLLKRLEVDIIKGTRVIRISAVSKDPKEASFVANEFARVYANPNLSQIEWNNTRVQNFVDVPSEPVKPNKNLNIILFVIFITIVGISMIHSPPTRTNGGLSILPRESRALARMGSIFFKKSNDGTAKDLNDIAVLLQLPVLGFVPVIKLHGRNIKTETDINRIVETDPLCMASEAYRLIRAKLLFSLNSFGSIAKSIIITSSAPDEGKTISAVNLAIMTAHSGENMLLVDAHIKKPRVHTVFNMDNDTGFTDYLSGRADFDSVVKHSGIDNLSIVTSGNASYKCAKSIFSKNIKLFLENSSARFSKVIFDAPSVALFESMAALLSICDGTILIIEGNGATKDLLSGSKELLRKKGANIIGVILNNVSF